MEFTLPASLIYTGAWTVAASCDAGCFAASVALEPGGDSYTLVVQPDSGEVTLPPGYPMHLLFPARAPRAGVFARAYAPYAPLGMGELSGNGAAKKRGRVECAGIGRGDSGGDDEEDPKPVSEDFLAALRAGTTPDSRKPAGGAGERLPAAGKPFKRPSIPTPPPRSENVRPERPPIDKPPPSSVRHPEVDREALERDFHRDFTKEVLHRKTPPPSPRLTPPPLPAREARFPISQSAVPRIEDARSQLPTVETPAVSSPDDEFSEFDDLRGEPTQVTRIAPPSDDEKPTVDGAVLEFAQWRDANYAVATKARREADIRSTEAIFSAAIAFLKRMPAPEIAKIADWRPARIIEVPKEREMHRLTRLAAVRTLLARTRAGDKQAAKAIKEVPISASRMFAALSDIERELVEVGRSRSALMRARKPAILDWLKREKNRTAEMLVLVLAAGNWPGLAFLSRLVREGGSRLAKEILDEAKESEESAARNALESFAKRPASARQFPTLQSFDIGATGAFSLSFWDVPQTAGRRNLPAILHLKKKYPELHADLARLTGEIKQWEAALGTRWHLSFPTGKEIGVESVAGFRNGLGWFANKKGINDLNPATCDFYDERAFAKACEILAAMLDEWQSLYKKWEETLYAAYLIITGRDGDASFIPLIHIDELHIAVAIDKTDEK